MSEDEEDMYDTGSPLDLSGRSNWPPPGTDAKVRFESPFLQALHFEFNRVLQRTLESNPGMSHETLYREMDRAGLRISEAVMNEPVSLCFLIFVGFLLDWGKASEMASTLGVSWEEALEKLNEQMRLRYREGKGPGRG